MIWNLRKSPLPAKMPCASFRHLSSSTVNCGNRIRTTPSLACSMRRRERSTKMVKGEMAGEYEENYEDVSKHMTDLFTYKAVRKVMGQLKETDPIAYRWLYEFTVENKPSNSFQYCKVLVKSNYELGERILAARLDLLADFLEKLPGQRESMLLNVRDTNLEVLRGHIKDSVNFLFTAKPRPDVDE